MIGAKEAKRAVALAGCALSACGGQNTVALGLPAEIEDQSVVVAHHVDEVWRFEMHSPKDTGWQMTTGPDTRLYLIGYALAPETIGVEDGVIAPSSDGPCALAFPDAAYELVSEKSNAAWRSVEVPAELIDELLPGAGCRGCATFDEFRVPVGDDRRLFASAPLSDGRALVSRAGPGAPNGPDEMVMVDRSGVVDLLEECSNARSLSVAPAADPDCFWLGGWILQKICVDVVTERCEVRTSTSLPTLEEDLNLIIDILPSPPEEPLSLRLLDSHGRLWSFDGDRFQIVAELEVHPNRVGRRHEDGGLVRLGPDRLVASGGDDTLVFLGPGPRRQLRLPFEFNSDRVGYDRITAMAWIEGQGLLVGGASGELFRVDASGEDFERLGESPAGDDVGVFLSLGRGFVATAQGGRLVQRHDGGRICPAAYQIGGGSSQDARYGFAQDDSLFLTDAISVDDLNHVVWLDARWD